MKDLIERGFAPGVLQSQLSHLDKASEIVWNYKLSQRHYRVKSIIAAWRRGYVPKQVNILVWVIVFPVVLIFCASISGQSIYQGSHGKILFNIRSGLSIPTRPCGLCHCMLLREQSYCRNQSTQAWK